MAVANLPIIPGDVGECYPSTAQELNLLMTSVNTVQFDISGATVLIASTSTPAVTDQDKLWYNPATGHTLKWNTTYTAWAQPHADQPSSDLIRIWVGAAADIDTIDGGTAGAVSPTTGPFWEIATEFAARFPVGVGTFPLSTTAVTVGATGGVDQVTLSMANLPAQGITGNTPIYVNESVPIYDATEGVVDAASTGKTADPTTGDFARKFVKFRTDDLGTGTALSNLVPYIGVYFIRRTAREFYTS